MHFIICAYAYVDQQPTFVHDLAHDCSRVFGVSRQYELFGMSHRCSGWYCHVPVAHSVHLDECPTHQSINPHVKCLRHKHCSNTVDRVICSPCTLAPPPPKKNTHTLSSSSHPLPPPPPPPPQIAVCQSSAARARTSPGPLRPLSGTHIAAANPAASHSTGAGAGGRLSVASTRSRPSTALVLEEWFATQSGQVAADMCLAAGEDAILNW